MSDCPVIKKCRAAVSLGRRARGIPKTISPEAKAARSRNIKLAQAARKAKARQVQD